MTLALACAAALTAWMPVTEENELKDESGKTIIRYAVEAPQGIAPAGTTDPPRQVGLFLCFPEHDHPTGDEILPVREALRRLGLNDGYVLLAGHPRGRKFGAADHEPIGKLIAWARKTYPVNPRRIYMYGKGEGGKISGEFTMLHPDLVTAAISYSWGWWRIPSELHEPIDFVNAAPEFYMVLGRRDLAHHLTTVRDTYSRVRAKGYHVIYREFDDLGARTYHPESNDDAIAWATRLRNKTIPLSPEEQQLLAREGARAKGNVPAAGYFPDLALVGGAPADAVVRKLLNSPEEKVRAAAARTCAHAIFDEATVEALGAKAVDPSPQVRAAAFRALAMYGNWRSAAAQQALIGLAMHPEKAVDARDTVSAVDGLAQSARLQVHGVRQDPQVFQTLVAMLESKDEELRVMASNVLAPIRDREFRGDSGRPERKAPPGGWPRWLDEITTQNAGYLKDYDVCASGRTSGEAEDLFCKGGASLLGYDLRTREAARKDPARAFQSTLRAAGLGYVPAEAAVGMMYAVGKGVEQDFAKAAEWWVKAAEGGHVPAAGNAAMVYRGGAGVPPDPKLADKWAKFAAGHAASGDTQ
ncbi:MAG: HEAT repeat domain-containing protein [Bryobacterales bacterium]|nr:HEAT repeat domain-containing protein [Bryobacterales bacterium]